jgi:hypothetical protein
VWKWFAGWVLVVLAVAMWNITSAVLLVGILLILEAVFSKTK